MSEPTDEFLKVVEEAARLLLRIEDTEERELALQLLEKELRDSGPCPYRIGGVFPCVKAGPHEHQEAPLA